MGKNKNLKAGREAALSELNRSLLQTKIAYKKSRESTGEAYDAVGSRLADSEASSFFDLITSNEAAMNFLVSGLDQVSGTLGASLRAQENALNAGGSQARGSLSSGLRKTADTLGTSLQSQEETFNQGREQAKGSLETGMGNVSNTLEGSLQSEQATLDQGQTQARTDILGSSDKAIAGKEAATQQGLDQLSPYSQAGGQALGDYQAALKDPSIIQDSAVSRYRKGQLEGDLARQLASKGLLNSGAAIEKYYTPGYNQINAEESQNYFDRLGTLLRGGQAAATTGAGLSDRQGDISAQVYGNKGQSLSAIEREAAQSKASSQSEYGQQLAGYQDRTGRGLSTLDRGTAQDIASSQSEYGQQLAGYQDRTGTGLASIDRGLGQDIANAQSEYGQQMAGYQDNASISQSNLANQLGANKIGLRGNYDNALRTNEYGYSDAMNRLHLGEASAVTNLNIQKGNTWQDYYQNKETPYDKVKKGLALGTDIAGKVAQVAGVMPPGA